MEGLRQFVASKAKHGDQVFFWQRDTGFKKEAIFIFLQ